MTGPRSIVIAAGGTGGHIFPGLAVARSLVRLAPDSRVAFLGTPRGLEGRLIPEAGFPLETVDMVPFSGKDRLRFPFALVKASVQAARVLQRLKADVAVSMGGYPGIPAISGAWLSRTPSVIHESGAVPGRANLLAARLTKNVAVAFESALSQLPAARVVGMPLDEEVVHLDRFQRRAEARASLDLDPSAFVVFVTGGSQGAASLNRAALQLGQRWASQSDKRIILKTGRAHHDEIVGELSRNGADRVVKPVSFFERITDAYAAADVVVSRAGAGSVAELAAVGMPSILVPYPFAPDDHQTVNARALVDQGGALLVRDHEVSADTLGPILESWSSDRSQLEAMGQAARSVGRPGAADEMARWVLSLADVTR